MTRRQKLLEKLSSNPRNVRFEDVDKLLRWCGYESRHRGGSHYVYKKAGCRPLTIPYRRPLKSVYVKKALAAIEACCAIENE